MHPRPLASSTLARAASLLCMLLALPAPTHATPGVWPSTTNTTNSVNGFYPVGMAIGSASDGVGGFFTAYSTGLNVLVQHIGADGRPAPGWPINGVLAGPCGNGEFAQPAVSSDGQGGALVAWENHTSGTPVVTVQRVLANGTIASGFPANGRAVSTTGAYDYHCAVTHDGGGGAIVAFVRSNESHVRAKHVLSNGIDDVQWPSAGRLVNPSTSTTDRPRLFPDGLFGAFLLYRADGVGLLETRLTLVGQLATAQFPGEGYAASAPSLGTWDAAQGADGRVRVAFTDARAGQLDLHLHAFDLNGPANWLPANGVPITDTPGLQEDAPSIAVDADQGTLLAWRSNSASSAIHATRYDWQYSLDPTWTSSDVTIATESSGFLANPSVTTDGAKGLYVAWNSYQSADVFAQRLIVGGVRAKGWGATGNPVANTSSGGSEHLAQAFPDGDRGLIVLYERGPIYSGPQDLFANRLRRNGLPGVYTPPIITAVRDVDQDQGGRLRVYWSPSELDTLPVNALGSYALWRRLPEPLALSRLATDARLSLRESDHLSSLREGMIRSFTAGATQDYWEYLGATPARAFPGYGQTVTTASDLTPYAPAPYELFMVESVSPAGALLGVSEADSGYSQDNLSPGPPIALAAAYTSGATYLHWARNPEPDLALYRIHRGTFAAFAATDENLVGMAPDTGFADPGAAGAYYLIVAEDIHGNRSAGSLLSPANTTDAGPGQQAGLTLAPIAPNPSRGRMSVRFTLPAASDALIDVYDASGRHVRSLASGRMEAGAHDLTWDGRDERGRDTAGGLMFVRLRAGGREVVQRAVRLGVGR